jgi:hypothetical protein
VDDGAVDAARERPVREGDGEGVDAGTTTSCVCLPEVPAGWDGPLVGDALADCEESWPDAGPLLHSGLDAGVHACSCQCSSPSAACLFLDAYNSNCSGRCAPGLSNLAAIPGCFATDNCSQFARIIVDGGGPCVPDSGIVRSGPTWQRSIRQCRGTFTSGQCPGANDPCVPRKPPTGAYCIAHAGDLPCPPSYAVRDVYFSSFTDTRSCTPCSCADAGGPCEVGWYTNSPCSEAERAGTMSQSACVARPSGGVYVKVVRDRAGCTPVGGTRTGQAAPSGAVTLCCRPD